LSMPWYLRKYFILTLALTAFLLIPAFFSQLENSTLTQILFLSLLLSTLYSVAHDRKLLIFGIILTIISQWGLLTPGQSQSLQYVAGLVCALLFLFTVIIVILRDIINTHEIQIDTMFGAVATYLLIGVAWALVYYIADILYPHAVTINTELPDQSLELKGKSDFSYYNYFSMVTMTSLGYGDIIPTHPVTRALATYQVVLGQMFIAILVARLVGIHLVKR